ncbi:hypothetical protein QF000_000813 [Paraburkholderia atlantica]|uniref:Uncharacterized protein n=1 Tax=Paraburkholderia atlantica TaxID=2654982 RepID=A0A7W8QH01_PARAM|nr:hypothetical protein [Paraburkholderia atlantica]MBB5429618.1 hypothetical protein [Paraburkholderia atlantica]
MQKASPSRGCSTAPILGYRLACVLFLSHRNDVAQVLRDDRLTPIKNPRICVSHLASMWLVPLSSAYATANKPWYLLCRKGDGLVLGKVFCLHFLSARSPSGSVRQPDVPAQHDTCRNINDCWLSRRIYAEESNRMNDERDRKTTRRGHGKWQFPMSRSESFDRWGSVRRRMELRGILSAVDGWGCVAA